MTDEPTIAATVSGFYVVPNQLRRACGAEGERFWLRADGDGAGSVVCDACHQEAARITADLMSVR
jgi:hypothetical protein